VLIFLIGIGIIGISLLYQAFECFMKFEVNLEGIGLDAEVLVDLHRLEVRSECAVVLTGDRDVPAVEESRIALSAPGQGFYKGEVLVGAEFIIIDVTAQNAMIVLAGLQATVAAEDGFQIHGEFRVSVPALEHL